MSDNTMYNPALVLFPGLGADDRLLWPQRTLPYRIVTPKWIDPLPAESFSAYARRMADSIDWPRKYIIGGVSMGGMIAAELTRHLQPDGLVMIASCRAGKSLPGVYRGLNALSKMFPNVIVHLGARIIRGGLNTVRLMSSQDRRLVSDMLSASSVTVLRRFADMVLRWEGVSDIPCPAIWIHGARDSVIPVRRVQPDRVIPDAGHLVNMTHAGQVNRIIVDFVESLQQVCAHATA